VTDRIRSLYRELRPPQQLAGRLVCLWTQQIEGVEGEYCHPVLPDGCADIVWIGDAPPVVAGPATRRILVKIPVRRMVFGVRFQPGFAASSLGVPADELLNRDVPLDEIWGAAAGRLMEQVFSHRTTPAKLRAVSDALTSRLARAPAVDPAVRAAVSWLMHRPGGRVRDLAQAIGLSDRQLQRRFRAAVGYGPKTFQRIMRLQRLLVRAEGMTSAQVTLAALASAAGYADQAHMCREFQALAEETPQSLLARPGSTLSMSDLFNTASGRSGYDPGLDTVNLEEESWSSA